jgi:hypothetical protein
MGKLLMASADIPDEPNVRTAECWDSRPGCPRSEAPQEAPEGTAEGSPPTTVPPPEMPRPWAF